VRLRLFRVQNKRPISRSMSQTSERRFWLWASLTFKRAMKVYRLFVVFVYLDKP